MPNDRKSVQYKFSAYGKSYLEILLAVRIFLEFYLYLTFRLRINRRIPSAVSMQYISVTPLAGTNLQGQKRTRRVYDIVRSEAAE